MAVMMCLSEMVSVRPVPGAIFEYPRLYVDPALGYAVGFIYWFVPRLPRTLFAMKILVGTRLIALRLAYSMSLATLTVSAAVLTKYWSSFSIPLPYVILILIIGIAFSNVFGVRVRSAAYAMLHSLAD
jgi:yeast amino acid transporter